MFNLRAACEFGPAHIQCYFEALGIFWGPVFISFMTEFDAKTGDILNSLLHTFVSFSCQSRSLKTLTDTSEVGDSTYST